MKSKIQKNEYQQAVAELLHIGDWIRFTASALQRTAVHFGHGTDNAWDEAVHLVLQQLYLPIQSDPLVFHSMLTIDERQCLVAALQQRIEQRKPLPYITQQAWCMGLPFYVDERVLIPRSPLAEWIMKQFQPWIEPEQVHAILEIGTGSGCLAIASAFSFPQATIDAVDIDEQALMVAAINVERHHMGEQVTLIHADCFQGLPSQHYDIIFSNPPYVSAAEMATLPAEYLHEPRVALEAEDDGLAFALRLIAQAGNYLTAHGILVVEVGNTAAALVARLPDLPCVWLEQEQGGDGLFLLTKQQLATLDLTYGG